MQTNYIKIKPLSVNSAFKGRRFKTKKYENYELELTYKAPIIQVPKGKLLVFFEFGLSSSGSDIDNCLKQNIDILSKKYKFNDNQIFDICVKKVVVKKGFEYIKFMFFEADKYEFKLVEK